jgi:hypothetical protein
MLRESMAKKLKYHLNNKYFFEPDRTKNSQDTWLDSGEYHIPVAAGIHSYTNTGGSKLCKK